METIIVQGLYRGMGSPCHDLQTMAEETLCLGWDGRSDVYW